MRVSSRVGLIACVIMAVGTAAPLAHASAVRAPSGSADFRTAPATTAPATWTRTDFNGDGYDDLLVPAPGEGAGAVAHTGAITVIPGSASGLNGARAVTLTPCTPGVPGPCAANDRWATTQAVGDFNGDGYSDVAIGAPQTIGSAALAGSVTILYGSPRGLTTRGARLFTGSLVGVAAAQRPFSLFGDALASGDFDGDGCSDLAVGAPGATVGGKRNAGMVIVLRGSANGLSTHASTLTPGVNGVVGTPVAGTAFGQVLLADDLDRDHRADLVVGVPQLDIGAAFDAGGVYRFWGSPSGVTASGQSVVTGSPSLHRELGLALAGPPGGIVFATAPGGGNAPSTVEQITVGRTAPAVMFAAYDDTDRADEYGDALLGADLGDHFNHSLIVGAPGFDGTGKVDAFDHHNIVHVITASAAPPAGPAPEFGVALAEGDFNGDGAADLVIGEPDANVAGATAAGQLVVMYSNRTGPDRSLTQLWNQESPGVPSASEPGDEWGRV